MNVLFRGFWSSTMATSSMTLAMFQFFSKFSGVRKTTLPPAEITQSVEEKAGLKKVISDELHQELSLVSHFGYGAGCGIAYALISKQLPGSVLSKGAFFGLTVWSASYFGIIPGLNLTPSAPKMNFERNLMMVTSHIVWGVALAYAEDMLRRDSSRLFGQERNYR